MHTRALISLAFASSLLVTACAGGATPSSSAAPVAPNPSAGTPATAGPATPVPSAPAAATQSPATPAPATPPPPTPVPQPTTAGQGKGTVDGRTFVSMALDGRSLVANSVITIGFAGPRISAKAGCNSLSGDWKLIGDTISVGAMASTMMACDPPLMDQDTWLAAFIDGSAMTLAGDTLTLAKDGITLTLTDALAANPSRPLESTRWVLTTILVGGDAATTVPAGVTSTLIIQDGMAQIQPGCNTASATVGTEVGTLTFGPIRITRMSCPGDQMDVEQAVLGVMTGAVPYTIDGNTLTLHGPANGLVYTAAP